MTGVRARSIVEAAVRRELFGPHSEETPRGKPLDCSSGTTHFDKREDSYGMWHEAASGQEVLTESDPLRRYGVGILFSGATQRGSAVGVPPEDDAGGTDEIAGVTGLSTTDEDVSEPAIEVEVKGTMAARGDADSDDFDLTDANSFKPSAMAVSFQCDVVSGGSLMVTVTGAYYDRVAASWPGQTRPKTWWVRRPFELTGAIAGNVLLDEPNRLKTIALMPTEGLRAGPRHSELMT